MKWTDGTSFSQGVTDRTPRVWKAHAGDVRLIVFRHRHHADDVWLLTAEPFFNMIELTSRADDEAKAEAERLVADELRTSLSALAPDGRSTE